MDNWKKYSNFIDRSCDGIILAFDPKTVLYTDSDRRYYIPSSARTCECLDKALKSICGEKKGSSSSWCDVNWGTIAELEKRVIEGLRLVTSHQREENSHLDDYLSRINNPRFDYTWVQCIGDLYRFEINKRNEALEKFKRYWNRKEIRDWKNIQRKTRIVYDKLYIRKD